MTPTSADGTGPEEWLEVALAADDRIGDYIPTLMNSIVRHTPRPMRVTLLSRGLSEALLGRIEATSPGRVQWRFIDMQSQRFGAVRLLRHTTISTMDRLLLPDLLPGVGRVVYIDIDTLVLGDLADLWRLPKPECGLTARRSNDVGYTTLGEVVERWAGVDTDGLRRTIATRGLGLLSPCFNAGVMLMDLDRLRDTGFTDFCLRIAADHQVNDQLAVNVYAAGRQGDLPRRWNVFVGRERVPDPCILHFVGPRKPWNRNPPYTEDWMRYYVPGLTPVRPLGPGRVLLNYCRRLVRHNLALRS
jgi:lipopolysaccharide biosynthesis glycosyltransferase